MRFASTFALLRRTQSQHPRTETIRPMFEGLKQRGFQVLTLHHAEAILQHDMSDAIAELETALEGVEIPAEELVRGGGGEGELTQRLRHALADERDWKKHVFEVRKIVDGTERESTTHQIDHVRKLPGGTIALEIEWNNKDPFFDRDLENFKRLHADGAISIGAIVTRGTTLHDGMPGIIEAFALARGLSSISDLTEYYQPTRRQIEKIEAAASRAGSFAKGWAQAFVSDKFGEATTHWRKLEERVSRGVGNPCPLLLVGIPGDVVTVPAQPTRPRRSRAR